MEANMAGAERERGGGRGGGERKGRRQGEQAILDGIRGTVVGFVVNYDRGWKDTPVHINKYSIQSCKPGQFEKKTSAINVCK